MILTKFANILRKIRSVAMNRIKAVYSHPVTIEKDPTEHDTLLSGWFKKETGELIEGFAIEPEDIVIDVGCGDSPFLHFCSMQGADVIFTDIDPEKIASMYRVFKDSSVKSFRAMVSDACSLPLKDAAVSKVIAMEVIEHVDDPSAFLKELVRIGKPGALYLITAPDPLSETLQKDLAPPFYFQKPNHIRIIERKELETWIVNSGLVVMKRKYYGFYWAMWWMLFWTCKQEFGSPWHPLLERWTQTWNLLLETQDGVKVKTVLDNFMPKSQAIIARKPD